MLNAFLKPVDNFEGLECELNGLSISAFRLMDLIMVTRKCN